MARFSTITSFILLAAASINASPLLNNLLDVNAVVCDQLDVNSPLLTVAQAACVKARVAAAQTSQAAVVDVTAQVNLFVSLLGECNQHALTLHNVLVGLTKITLGLLDATIVPTLTQVAVIVDDAVISVNKLVVITDAKVQASVFVVFQTLAVTLQTTFTAIVSAQASLTVLAHKAVLHSILIRLQASLQVLVDNLFARISVDLDVANLRTTLFVNLQAAIEATV